MQKGNNDEEVMRYIDSEEREITIVDELKAENRAQSTLREVNALNIQEGERQSVFRMSKQISVDDMVQFNYNTHQSLDQTAEIFNENNFTLGKEQNLFLTPGRKGAKNSDSASKESVSKS